MKLSEKYAQIQRMMKKKKKENNKEVKVNQVYYGRKVNMFKKKKKF